VTHPDDNESRVARVPSSASRKGEGINSVDVEIKFQVRVPMSAYFF
jgi:hypothetical protein